MEDNNIETLETNTEPVVAPVQEPVTPVAPVQEPVQPVQPVQPTPVAPQPAEPEIPWNYKPISAWGYVGYEILFCIPIVGFIFMLVYAFSNNNINRRNFARSYLIYLIIGLVLGVIVGIIAFIAGYSFSTIKYY